LADKAPVATETPAAGAAATPSEPSGSDVVPIAPEKQPAPTDGNTAGSTLPGSSAPDISSLPPAREAKSATDDQGAGNRQSAAAPSKAIEPPAPPRAPAGSPATTRDANPSTSAAIAPPPPTDAPKPAAPAARQTLAADEITTLVARGDALLRTGDIVSARLYYERAANAGDGHAALLMAETFDPDFLERAGVRGVRGDPSQAAIWYARARDLGDRDAERRFQLLDKQK
jgi:hypothetical protein